RAHLAVLRAGRIVQINCDERITYQLRGDIMRVIGQPLEAYLKLSATASWNQRSGKAAPLPVDELPGRTLLSALQPPLREDARISPLVHVNGDVAVAGHHVGDVATPGHGGAVSPEVVGQQVIPEELLDLVENGLPSRLGRGDSALDGRPFLIDQRVELGVAVSGPVLSLFVLRL